jgi:RNA polymerase sigma-70 factor (ECF subfamily)
MDQDAEVIRQVQCGNGNAFRALVERYQCAVYALAGQLLPDAHEADDAAQDAFVQAYHHLDSFDPRRGCFSTWLLAITRNTCLNRRKRRRDATLATLPELAVTRGPGVELEWAETFARLDAALARLPVDQRVVFVLAELHELPLAEVARIEQVRLGTVKSRLSRAKAKLRAVIEPLLERP